MALAKAVLIITVLCAVDGLREDICCFDETDVVAKHLPDSKHRIVVIDGFFCPRALQLIINVAKAASDLKLLQDIGGNFPGMAFRAEGQMIKDIASHAGVSDSLEQVEAILNGSFLDCLVRTEAANIFDFTPEVVSKSENARFSMITRASSRSMVHVDTGSLVVNAHLAANFEDTGTAFWRTAEKQEACLGDDSAMRACHMLLDDSACFGIFKSHNFFRPQPCMDLNSTCAIQADRGACSDWFSSKHIVCPKSCGLCNGLLPGPHLPHGLDHAGNFEMYHVEDFKLNRVVFYSGHLFHSGYFSEDSFQRLNTTDPSVGRLMLQSFIEQPKLQEAHRILNSFDMKDSAEEAIGKLIKSGKGRRSDPVADLPAYTKQLLTKMSKSGALSLRVRDHLRRQKKTEEELLAIIQSVQSRLTWFAGDVDSSEL